MWMLMRDPLILHQEIIFKQIALTQLNAKVPSESNPENCGISYQGERNYSSLQKQSQISTKLVTVSTEKYLIQVNQTKLQVSLICES